MAILLTGCGNRFQQIMPGERRLSQRLQEKLDDDALIWFIVGADPRLRVLSLAIQFSCLISLIVLAILPS